MEWSRVRVPSGAIDSGATARYSISPFEGPLTPETVGRKIWSLREGCVVLKATQPFPF